MIIEFRLKKRNHPNIQHSGSSQSLAVKPVTEKELLKVGLSNEGPLLRETAVSEESLPCFSTQTFKHAYRRHPMIG